MAKTSPREAERSNVYYPGLFPPARPLLLDAVKRGLARHRTGLARVLRAAGAGIRAHGGQGTPLGLLARGGPAGGHRGAKPRVRGGGPTIAPPRPPTPPPVP